MMIHRILRCCVPSTASHLYYSTSVGLKDSSKDTNLFTERLKSRGILKVKGQESSPFLQGLFTNDMNHFEVGAKCIYSLILNLQGRLMYDCIIYKHHEENAFLVECDIETVDAVQKQLKMYRVRRKIDIDNVSDSLETWAVFSPISNIQELNQESPGRDGIVLCGPEPAKPKKELSINKGDNVICVGDPRMNDLGWRMIIPKGSDPNKYYAPAKTIEPGSDVSYVNLRYTLGVGEGVSDFPAGKCFPLETNGDYMHGISFHKGCYVGQELTARIHHTGVVRKRYMPLFFDTPVSDVPFDMKISDEKNKSVGKLRGFNGKYGIGLMRIDECLSASNLKLEGVNLITRKPHWWPLEASKENQILKQNKTD